MKLLFEIGKEGRGLSLLPPCDVPETALPAGMERELPLHLPQVSENELSRHFTKLAERTHGVNKGFYPLGSCTMKYNPKLNEELAALPGFTQIHPLQPQETVQGCLAVIRETGSMLAEITGMDAFTLQPAAGAHGEFTGLLLIKAYHHARGDSARKKILVPDSAHGTNPASASMCGFEVVSIPSNEKGQVDLEALRSAAGADTAGLMLTNPNTVGLFEEQILDITRIVHEAGGLCYYDGANLNAIMGQARPGDMGFDCIHSNLHKTFSTPHGGGGPGAGAVGCKAFLAKLLPGPVVTGSAPEGYRMEKPAESIGAMKQFFGNFAVVVRAYAYLLTLGKEGIPAASANAVLNANYMRKMLEDTFDVAYDTTCMHEFVVSCERLKKETGVSAMDIAKGMLDFGIHPPTMYFPLIVHEALMLEPTETEARETLDEAVAVMKELAGRAETDPESLHSAPHGTVIGRPDEVAAARNPVLRFTFE